MKQEKKLVAKPKTVTLTVLVIAPCTRFETSTWFDDRGFSGSWYCRVAKTKIVKIYKDHMQTIGRYVPKKVRLIWKPI